MYFQVPEVYQHITMLHGWFSTSHHIPTTSLLLYIPMILLHYVWENYWYYMFLLHYIPSYPHVPITLCISTYIDMICPLCVVRITSFRYCICQQNVLSIQWRYGPEPSSDGTTVHRTSKSSFSVEYTDTAYHEKVWAYFTCMSTQCMKQSQYAIFLTTYLPIYLSIYLFIWFYL